MKNRIFFKSALMFLCLTLMSYTGFARGLGGKGDVFKGKLFPPNIIMENREALGLTKKQFTAIRAIVVEVRTNVAEHEWDMQDAYRRVLSKLDETPVDEGQVLENVRAVLKAENQVKLMQITMLIKLRNLLTVEQVEYLKGKKSK